MALEPHAQEPNLGILVNHQQCSPRPKQPTVETKHFSFHHTTLVEKITLHIVDNALRKQLIVNTEERTR